MANETEYFRRLTEILRQHGFGWVVAQAQAEIAEGRTVTKEVRAPDIHQSIEPDTLIRQPQRRRRAAMVATEPYDSVERLSILVRGIDAAIIGRAALEEEVLNTTGAVSRIEFLPDETEISDVSASARSHYLERGRLDTATRIRRDLSKALDQLRRITDGGA